MDIIVISAMGGAVATAIPGLIVGWRIAARADARRAQVDSLMRDMLTREARHASTEGRIRAELDEAQADLSRTRDERDVWRARALKRRMPGAALDRLKRETTAALAASAEELA